MNVLLQTRYFHQVVVPACVEQAIVDAIGAERYREAQLRYEYWLREKNLPIKIKYVGGGRWLFVRGDRFCTYVGLGKACDAALRIIRGELAK